MSTEPLVSRLPIVVRSTEVDMLGHVNNAVYQQWLEWGRFEWVRDSGLDFDHLAKQGFALVVVHVSLDYRAEAKMDDEMVIETSLTRIGTSSLTFRQRVLHAEGRVACEATVVLACFDTQARRGCALAGRLARAAHALRRGVSWRP